MIEIVYKPNDKYTQYISVWSNRFGLWIESRLRLKGYQGDYTTCRCYGDDSKAFQDALSFLLDN